MTGLEQINWAQFSTNMFDCGKRGTETGNRSPATVDNLTTRGRAEPLPPPGE